MFFGIKPMSFIFPLFLLFSINKYNIEKRIVKLKQTTLVKPTLAKHRNPKIAIGI